MSQVEAGQVAIVDYGMGNLYSVKHACNHAGLGAIITAEPRQIMAADAVILPGVGAFGDAMGTLERLGLVTVLHNVAVSQKPLIGICLGMQLLMTESDEFGRHRGLGIIEGEVVRLQPSGEGLEVYKVPQIGWNQIYSTSAGETAAGSNGVDTAWKSSLLNGVADGEYVYFVHSYYAKPADGGLVVSTTRYGSIEFCSSLRFGNVFACQFHPERSGSVGLQVYHNLAKLIAVEASEEPIG